MADLHAATFIGLEFTNQKNGIKGEIIGLSHSQLPIWCPVKATICRVLTLYAKPRHHKPFHTYCKYHCWYVVTAAYITAYLLVAACVVGLSYGIFSTNISAQSLCASGAMALLCADINSDRISLLLG